MTKRKPFADTKRKKFCLLSGIRISLFLLREKRQPAKKMAKNHTIFAKVAE